ncbi:MAG: serine protease [Patescibacteria group bacterium]
MPALQGVISALSALIITLNSLYGTQIGSTTPQVTGIFGPTATSTVPLPKAQLPKPAPPKPAAPTGLAPLLPDAPSTDLALALGTLRGAIVNIVCMSKDAKVRSMSGSGVIFDPKGLILTNSHIAQYYMLKEVLPEGAVTCTIRAGSPAQAAYRAEAAYVSSEWIQDNPDTIAATVARGTGEHDFAVLAITESASPIPLPSSFPYVPLTKATPKLKDNVGIGSYGAQNLTSKQIQSSLLPTLVFAQVKSIFTFDSTSVDLLTLSGSAAGQHGSSGGGIVNASGQLVGIITTASDKGEFGNREVRVVTAGHIRSSFKKDSGQEFDSYFRNGSVKGFVSVFVDDAERMGKKLLATLGR